MMIFATLAAGADARYKLQLPSKDLNVALVEFAERTGIQLVYPARLAKGLKSTALDGEYAPEAALAKLLEGTGLRFQFTNAKTVTISPSGGTRTLGPVRVEGADARSAANGVNGSRDITATEGTNSYTSGALTIGSKAPQSIKETPQSVSVLTRQQIEDQNIGDFRDAMTRATGVTMAHNANTYENFFYSRGFEIKNIQVDGGAPLMASSTYGFTPLMDLAQYDHVEVLRGAAGLFNAYDDPAGTINLVRKKPLDHSSVSVEGQVGSWSTRRAVIDATAPLAFDGRLRGRMVFTYHENEYFYDIARDNRTLAYGVLEYDVTPSLLFTSGVSVTRQEGVPNVAGLPRYQNGDDLKLPRDTCLCFPWSRWNFDTRESFASLEQSVGENWRLKLNLTHEEQTAARKYGNVSGAVNPLTSAGPMINASMMDIESKQLAAELTMTGAFDILGQRQQIAIGVSSAEIDGDGRTEYAPLIAGTSAAPYVPYPGGAQYYSGSPNGVRPPVDVFNFNPLDPRYTEPRDALIFQRYTKYGEARETAYITARLTAFDRWHLATGLRYSRSGYTAAGDVMCTDNLDTVLAKCANRTIGSVATAFRQHWSDDDFAWPPSLSLSYDVTQDLVAFVGYTDVYQSQGRMLDADLHPIGPITGSNMEVGLKWAGNDEKLNASLSGYRIKQDGFGITDPSRRVVENGVIYYVSNDNQRFQSGNIDGQHYCCYIANSNQRLSSEGIDLELSGELAANLQLNAGYTWNVNRKEGSYYGDDEEPVASRQPEHLLKLWGTYRFRGEGPLARLMLSVGANWQSSAFVAGSACTELRPPDRNGVSTCAPGKTIDYDYTQDPYAVWSTRVAYTFNNRWNVALNIENLTDEVYYQTMGTNGSNNWYGAPRSYTMSLRGTF